MKLLATPSNMMSWNFHLTDGQGADIHLNVGWFREQCAFECDGVRYQAFHKGFMTGSYVLSDGANTVAAAYKRMLSRAFDVETRNHSLRLVPATMFTRGFELYESGCRVGEIRPNHVFTRSTTIDVHADITVPEAVFLFWLVMLTWRRAAASSAAVGP